VKPRFKLAIYVGINMTNLAGTQYLRSRGITSAAPTERQDPGKAVKPKKPEKKHVRVEHHVYPQVATPIRARIII
jgi:hypothetical protein